MPVLSNTLLLCTLPATGHKAVYEVQPQHMNDQPDTDLNTRALRYGKQIAHEFGERWYKPEGWVEITDLRTIALLERSPCA
jgi:hypothetical protein